MHWILLISNQWQYISFGYKYIMFSIIFSWSFKFLILFLQREMQSCNYLQFSVSMIIRYLVLLSLKQHFFFKCVLESYNCLFLLENPTWISELSLGLNVLLKFFIYISTLKLLLCVIIISLCIISVFLIRLWDHPVERPFSLSWSLFLSF